MSVNYASGKHAFGFCDRCGFRYPLAELKFEIEDNTRNGLRVCGDCKDPDHPQLQLGRFRIFDPQTLNQPRPDLGLSSTNSLFGWNPVGDNITLELTATIGSVTVSTS